MILKQLEVHVHLITKSNIDPSKVRNIETHNIREKRKKEM